MPNQSISLLRFFMAKPPHGCRKPKKKRQTCFCKCLVVLCVILDICSIQIACRFIVASTFFPCFQVGHKCTLLLLKTDFLAGFFTRLSFSIMTTVITIIAVTNSKVFKIPPLNIRRKALKHHILYLSLKFTMFV